MNAASLTDFRAELQSTLEDTWPANILLPGSSSPIAAARGKIATGANPELTGFLPTEGVTYRIRRNALPAGFAFAAKRTVITENGLQYRVTDITDEASDPALVLHCEAI